MNSHRKYSSKEYAVYDLNNNYLFSGDVRHLCKKLDITKSTICKASNGNSVVRRKYRIIYLGKERT